MSTTTRRRLELEALEIREVLSADWFTTYLPNPAVATLARNDWNGHGAVNYNDMLAIYHQVAADGHVDSSEFASLQFLSSYGYLLNMSGPVQALSTEVISHDPASLHYQGTTFGSYLGANSSSVQLNDLVNKWFLGMDHPTLTTSGYYSSVSGSLFGSGGPSYMDVYQGALGDCTVLASVAETAARTSLVSSMFTANGNNTWTVRFYHAGAPVYVTVDNQLPDGGGLYDHPHNNVLWAALAEKAYAQLNEEGWLGTLAPGSDSYNAINNGNSSTMATALGALTGRSASAISVNPTNIASALSSGKLVVIGTGNTVSNKDIEHNHCYAVVGYNASAAQPFTVFNPWGMAGGYDGSNFIWGQFTANGAALSAYFVSGASTSSMPTAAQGSAVPFVTKVTAPLAPFSAAASPASHADAAFAALQAPATLLPAVDVAQALSGHQQSQEAGLLDQLFGQGLALSLAGM